MYESCRVSEKVHDIGEAVQYASGQKGGEGTCRSEPKRVNPRVFVIVPILSPRALVV